MQDEELKEDIKELFRKVHAPIKDIRIVEEENISAHILTSANGFNNIEKNFEAAPDFSKTSRFSGNGNDAYEVLEVPLGEDGICIYTYVGRIKEYPPLEDITPFSN